jgi:hypothetical protein
VNEVPPIEPSADLRQLAQMCRATFLALTGVGFTDTQALVIIGHMLRANAGTDS